MSQPVSATHPIAGGQPGAPDIVLASGSTARAALLAEAGIRCRIRPATIDESAAKRAAQRCGRSAAETALRLARLKARQIARGGAAGLLVIGADQMLECDGVWFDKPVDLPAAHTQLRILGGRTHSLWSAVSLWRDGAEIFSDIAGAELTMHTLTDTGIDAYLAAEGPGICASVGAYRIEGHGAALFSRIAGGQDVIMGLPMAGLLAIFEPKKKTAVAGA